MTAGIDNSGRTLGELLADVARELDRPPRLRQRLSPAERDRIMADILADPVSWGRIFIFAADAARKAGQGDE